MAQAFRNLGYKVICYNYRTRLKNYYGDQRQLEDDLISTITAIKNNGGIDLIIFCKTDSLPVSAHTRATDLCKTFYWFMDPITTARAMHAGMRAKVCDAASATCFEVVKYFKEEGQPDSFKINEGADLELFKNLNMKKVNDVLFVGSPTVERHQFINYLVNHGIKVKVFGDGWHGQYGAMTPIYNASLVAEINQAKIVLNVSRTDSYSDRVTLSMAAGAFMMTSDTNEIHSDFLARVHLDTFGSNEELLAKVKYYLKKDEERERIAKTGCEFVRDRFGWETSCNHILGKANEYLF